MMPEGRGCPSSSQSRWVQAARTCLHDILPGPVQLDVQLCLCLLTHQGHAHFWGLLHAHTGNLRCLTPAAPEMNQQLHVQPGRGQGLLSAPDRHSFRALANAGGGTTAQAALMCSWCSYAGHMTLTCCVLDMRAGHTCAVSSPAGAARHVCTAKRAQLPSCLCRLACSLLYSWALPCR